MKAEREGREGQGLLRSKYARALLSK